MNVKDYPMLKIDDWLDEYKKGNCLTVVTTLNGNSMQPLIRKDRDIVTISPDTAKAEVGQIAVFRISDNTCIVHRIIEINEKYIRTCGDNCRYADRPIHPSQIIGIVTQMERNGKNYRLDGKMQIIYGKMWNKIFRKLWFIALKIKYDLIKKTQGEH